MKMLVLGLEWFQEFWGCGQCLITNICDRVVLFSWVKCKKCSCSFVCVKKIIIGGSFRDFVKIRLNELLGLPVFGVRCCDCYDIGIIIIFLKPFIIKYTRCGICNLTIHKL